jgi:N-acyl-D-aspartate/D-glutamate deacylase
MLDLVIKNGSIADGTGKARFQGDVGVKDDRIVEVGAVTTPAKRTVNADGLLVTPGFVDIHTHFDGQVSWDSMLAPSSQHGVTSVAMGNCGVGFAPARKDKHEFLIQLLEGVEDIPGTALAEGLSWDWESFPDYLNALDRRKYTIDIGAHIPHAALRAYVMGDRGADHTQHPTEAEITEMSRLTFEAVEAGALGFSTSRTIAHKSVSGANIGTLQATHRELRGIAEALGRAKKGVIQLISDAYLDADPDFAKAEMEVVRMLAEVSRRNLSFTVLQADHVPDRYSELMAAAREMTKAGLVVRTQVAPRPAGAILSFSSSFNPFLATATYKSLQSLPLAERLARLAQPETKAKILAEHRAITYTGTAAMIVNLERMFRLADPVDYEPLPGSSLQAEAGRAGRPADDYAYDVFLEDGGRRMIYMAITNYTRGNLDDVYQMMTDPNSLYGLSDAGAHCNAVSDGSFPTTALTLWTRGNRSGHKIPVETIVHGYSQRNAAHVGWMDRGVVAPGYLADLNVIDLDRLTVMQPHLVPDLPAGGTRYLQTAEGYRWTVKRGEVIVEDGAFTGALPGRLLRGAQSAP